MSLTTFFSK